MPEPASTLVLDDPNPLDESAVAPPDPRALDLFKILSILMMTLLLASALAAVILPKVTGQDAPLSALEGERLSRSLGLVDKYMRSLERYGWTVTREKSPLPAPASFGEEVTLTAVPPDGGVSKTYHFQYTLEPDPLDPEGDRLVKIIPLNDTAASLISGLGLQVDPEKPEAPALQ